MKPIYIFSSSGFGKETYGCAKRLGYTIAGFVEKEKQKKNTFLHGVPVISEDMFDNEILAPEAAVVAVGDSKLREKIATNIMKKWPSCEFPNVIDPTCALVVPEAIKLGIGIVMMPFCLLTVDITLGDFCQLGGATIIGHDCIIGDYVTTGMTANIAGKCKLGRSIRIGSQVVIKEDLSVCSDTIIGLNTGVVSNITEPGVYIGTPARKIK